VPGDNEDGTVIVAMEVPVPPDTTGTVDGLNATVMPAGAEYVSGTFAENWLRLAKEIVDATEFPGMTLMEFGFAEMLKSAKTVIGIVLECVSTPVGSPPVIATE